MERERERERDRERERERLLYPLYLIFLLISECAKNDCYPLSVLIFLENILNYRDIVYKIKRSY